MPEIKNAKRNSTERSVVSCVAAGGTDEHGIRAKLEESHEEETFPVGDEVICAHCSLTGAVAATNGPDAPSFWSCRGKSFEHLDETTHVDRH